MAKYVFNGSVEADTVENAPPGKYQFNGPVQTDTTAPADAGNDSTAK